MIRWRRRPRDQVGAVIDQDRELVATEPSGDIVGAQDFAQAVGDVHEEAIARRVAQRVVDDLEVVEIEEQDHRESVRRPAIQLLLHALEEQARLASPVSGS